MKAIKASLLFLVSLLFSCTKESPSNLMLLDADIPTDKPLIFAKGIISTDGYEFAITFSPEMDELYFTRRNPEEDNKIYTMQLVDGKWSNPEPAFFTASEGWDFEPHISPKGDKLYFGSTRPLPDSLKSNGLHQWYSTKTKNGWSNPVPLERPFRDKSIIMYLTSSENENLYFTTGEKGDKPEDWVIYKSIKEDGQYQSIDRMGKEINATGKWVAHSYIAPDESYMIYDFKSDSGYGESDLYISFNQNGTWSKPYNLGPKVNTDHTEMAASVSPDGKYLFFHRGGNDTGNIYWVDFETLKEKLLENMDLILGAGKTNSEKSYLNNSPTVESIYFNEKPPQAIPKLFAPSIVNTDSIEINTVFNPSFTELFFTRIIDKKFVIHHAEFIKGKWSEPKPLQMFKEQDKESVAIDPSISQDGNTMYFLGISPEDHSEKSKPDIYKSQKIEGNWQLATKVGYPVSTQEYTESYPVVVADGSLYFTSNRPGGLGKGDIYRAQYLGNGKFDTPVNIGPEVNSEKGERSTYVSSDESFLITANTYTEEKGFAVSFKKNGKWQRPAFFDLGENIDENWVYYCPYISPDNNYFFFSKRYSSPPNSGWNGVVKGEVYWVKSDEVFKQVNFKGFDKK